MIIKLNASTSIGQMFLNLERQGMNGALMHLTPDRNGMMTIEFTSKKEDAKKKEVKK